MMEHTETGANYGIKAYALRIGLERPSHHGKSLEETHLVAGHLSLFLRRGPDQRQPDRPRQSA